MLRFAASTASATAGIGLLVVFVSCSETKIREPLVDAAVDRSTMPLKRECDFTADCPPLSTIPPNCAVARCDQAVGLCVYSAIDGDKDGHRTNVCALATDAGTGNAMSNKTIQLGEDCDDTNPSIVPGIPVACSETELGEPITFPKGPGIGVCKAGQRSCTAEGKLSACIGAVGAKVEQCGTSTVDEDCDGNPLNGCACTTGQTAECGSSAMGKCKKGVTTCDGTGKFGACVGSVEPLPRNCASADDNDCDGKPDNTIDTVCTCIPGATRACNEHPGKDGVGQCRAGSQTCVNNTTSTQWGACTGDVAPSGDNCSASSPDFDCDGVRGNNPSCWASVSCDIQFDWIRGFGCEAPFKIFTSDDGSSIPIYECTNGATPAIIYAQAFGCGFGSLVRFMGYSRQTSGGAGWKALHGNHAPGTGGFILE